MLSVQGQRAADKINRRSLDTLTTQSTMIACVRLCGHAQSMSLCKAHVKDVKRHFEGVESRAEYEEPVYSLLDVLSVIRMMTRGGVAAAGS